jgi:aryl-alcohol dehydrogenase-like predicted oxidoreductase
LLYADASAWKGVEVIAQRRLGTQGLIVGQLGRGAMGMSAFYGGAPEAEATRVIHHALDAGGSLTGGSAPLGSRDEHLGVSALGPATRGRGSRRRSLLISSRLGGVTVGGWLKSMAARPIAMRPS